MAKTVAARVQELRKERGWTQQQLADALGAVGWPTDRSTVVRLEAARRGISVDDLVALAVALNVSPGWLLVPPVAGEEDVRLVGSTRVPGWAAWQWIDGMYPLPTSDEDGYNSQDEIEAYQRGRPAELRQHEMHPATQAARDVVHRVQRVLWHASKPQKEGDLGIVTTLKRARAAVNRVVAELDELEVGSEEGDHGRHG